MNKTKLKSEKEDDPPVHAKMAKTFPYNVLYGNSDLDFRSFTEHLDVVKNNNMITIVLTIAGVAIFGLFMKSIDFFEKI
ncbi:hypothetical protein [Sphingobacterium sp.]|uniref:hypothetical protein n=1 Tax=Sphingobacterium sp. TaxID=341027 RepID=UPI00289E7D71|nr:hypothetical protein [Sphingobacterium sp.]